MSGTVHDVPHPFRFDGKSAGSQIERFGRLNSSSGLVIFWIVWIVLIMLIIDSSRDSGSPYAPDCYQGPYGYECD